MRYSRELRNMVYFEAYGFNPVIYGRKRYIAYEGMVLSSFRPVEALVDYITASRLREAMVKKYVILKSTSNKRVVIAGSDRVTSIYDRKRLRQLTGKEATVPERIAMRLQTVQRSDDDMLFIGWYELPSYTFSKPLVLLLLYYVRSRIGMKMFKLTDYEDVKKLVEKLHYIDGLLVDHSEATVFIPRPVKHVHYNDVRRAFISLKAEERRELYEEGYLGKLYDEEEEELPI